MIFLVKPKAFPNKTLTWSTPKDREQAGPGTSLGLGQGVQAWVTQSQKPPVTRGVA